MIMHELTRLDLVRVTLCMITEDSLITVESFAVIMHEVTVAHAPSRIGIRTPRSAATCSAIS